MATGRRPGSKDAILKLRVESEVLERWKSAAGEQGLSMWARQILGEEAGTGTTLGQHRRSDLWWEVAQDATRRLQKLDERTGVGGSSAAIARRRAEGLRRLATVASAVADRLERYGYTRPL